MPHIIIETSQNLTLTQPAKMLVDITNALWQSGEFKDPEQLKARLYSAPYSLVGIEADTVDSFILVTFYLMKGRDNSIKQVLVERIIKAISTHITEHEKINTQGKLQICVNPIELSDTYQKVAI